MPELILDKRTYEIGGIVFDKDGTLIDFHATWGPILRKAVADLVEPLADKRRLSDRIFAALGVDKRTMRAHDGPYSISTFDKIYTVITTVLYQHGMKWTDAEQHVYRIFKTAAESPPPVELLKPTTDLPRLFNRLHAKGINIAVATADYRTGTLDTLEKLQCQTDSIFIACGDDTELPSKPDPALLQVIAASWDVDVKNVAMVGDTVGDVYMASQAGAVSIGVLTGAGTSEQLIPYTQAVLESIEQIRIK